MGLYKLLGKLLQKKLPQPKKISPKKKLLLVNLQGKGDSLMLTPLLTALKKAEKTVDVLTLSANHQLFQNDKNINKVLTFRGVLSTLRTINKANYDLIFLTHGAGPKSGLFFRFLKAKHKACHRYNLGGYWTGFKADIQLEQTPKLHRVEENLKLLDALGLKKRKHAYMYTVPVKASAKAREYWRRHFKKGETIIGIHPGGDKANPQKRYPLKKYCELVNNLPKEYKALFFLGPDEDELATSIRKRCRKENYSIYKGDLQTVAALLKRCHILVHSDSGLGHLAAAVGTRTLTIAGATNWHRTRPYGGKDRLIKARGCPEPKKTRMEESNIRAEAPPWPSSQQVLKEAMR